LESGGNYGVIKYPGGSYKENVNEWNFGNGLIRPFKADSRWFAWFEVDISGNSFAGYWTRFEPKAGLGYSIFNRAELTWKLKLGSDYFYDNLTETNALGGDFEEFWEGYAATDFAQTIKDGVDWYWSANYSIPFEQTDSYRLNAKLGWAVKINATMSLKQEVTFAYQNKPNRVKQLDANGDEVIDPVSGVTNLVPAERLDTMASLVIVFNLTPKK
jgi:hypothetical protein